MASAVDRLRRLARARELARELEDLGYVLGVDPFEAAQLADLFRQVAEDLGDRGADVADAPAAVELEQHRVQVVEHALEAPLHGRGGGFARRFPASAHVFV